MIRSELELPQGSDEEAADWCMRLAEGGLQPAEQAQFDAWVRIDGNRSAFQDALAIWQGIDEAAHLPEFIDIRSNALSSYKAANIRRWLRLRRSLWPVRGGIAAALLMVFTCTLTLRDPVETFQTSIGERQIAMLDDGSRVSMDAATDVEVRLRDDRRDLTLLRGRAKFDVAKDPLRPFTVRAGDKLIVATGTSFSVELVGNQVRVLLYEGHVELLDQSRDTKPRQLLVASKGGAKAAELTPGQELVASIAKPEASIVSADPPRALTWENGQLNMENEPLGLAIQRVNRYSNRQIKLADSETAGLRVSGVFTAGDTGAFLEAVEAYSPVAAEGRGNEILIKRKQNAKKVSESGVPTG
jgi:transmembrane sensor